MACNKNVGNAVAVGAAGAVEIHHEEHGEDAGPRRASLRSTWVAIAAGGGRRSRAGMAPRSGAKEQEVFCSRYTRIK